MSRSVPTPPRRIAAAVLAAVLLAPSARAAIAPEARPVVERYLQATGGRAAHAAQRSQYIRLSLEAFGFKGTAESWTVAPDREASQVALGPFNLRSGFDGANGWRTDPGGKLIRLDGKDLDDARASAWFSNDRWLEPDQGGGEIAFKGTEKDSAGEYAVVEITPPAGRPRTVYFDARTGLTARIVTKQEAHTVVTTYADWRPAAGRVVAHRMVQSVVGMPMNTVTQTLDSIAVDVDVPSSRFAAPDEGESPVTWLKSSGTARLPFEYRSHHVWLRASVNGGPPADFLFDTGASITVIDSGYAAKTGLPVEGAMQGAGAGASGSAAFSHLGSLRIEAADGDGIEMKDVKVAVLSVNAMLAPFFWRDCAGIIGFNVLGRFVNRIDYDGRLLTFHDPKAFRYEGQGAKVPFRLAGFIPVVPMTIDGRYSGEFRLDVGSGSTVDLHSPFVKQHGLVEKAKRSVEVLGGGFGGTFSSRLTRVGSMQLGPYTWKDAVVSLHTGEQGMLSSADYAGNVGNRILDRFALTLDYENRVAWFEPGKNLAKADHVTRFGAQLALIDGAVRAAQVIPGSAAAKAGMRDMDEVVSIDGKPAREQDPDTLDRLFEERPPGSKVVVEVLRDGKPRRFTVKLKDLL